MATTIKGGYYLDADGNAHDAHGNPVPKRRRASEAPPPEVDEVAALRARIAELEAAQAGAIPEAGSADTPEPVDEPAPEETPRRRRKL